MMNDFCEMCRGLRGHRILKQHLSDEISIEHQRAKRERERLQKLWQNVCWFDFEVQCRGWRYPWQSSAAESFVILLSQRVEQTRCGEIVTTPVYFVGTIAEAFLIPLEILRSELEEAEAYEKYLEEAVNAPFDYAPGGAKYLELLHITSVPTYLSKRSTENGGSH